MAVLERMALMISPWCITTASPVPTSVPIQRKGMLNLEKSFWLYTGKNNSENLSHSSWPCNTPLGKAEPVIDPGKLNDIFGVLILFLHEDAAQG